MRMWPLVMMGLVLTPAWVSAQTVDFQDRVRQVGMKTGMASEGMQLIADAIQYRDNLRDQLREQSSGQQSPSMRKKRLKLAKGLEGGRPPTCNSCKGKPIGHYGGFERIYGFFRYRVSGQ